MRTPKQILDESTTVAVVGASQHPEKAAHSVPLQLRLHGWRVIPVNPFATTIWGEHCYARLADIPHAVDLVNVFRPPDEATAIVRQAVEFGARAVWLQQGITSAEGRRIAAEAGIDYVEDLCIAVIRAIETVTKR